MKVIGCYIVKNESKHLSRSIESLKGQVDEIIVVDTGSTDDTVKIAQSSGAKVFDFEWCDDFSAARNYALSKLKGDWVVFLDADEYFDKETSENLRRVIIAQNSKVNLLLVRRHDIDENGKIMMSLYVPRIFRIRNDLRYAGIIHEELRQNSGMVEGVISVPKNTLLLIHTGYVGELGEQKARRNLSLILREMKFSKEPERFYGYLAETYNGLDDTQQAMYYAYKDIARGRQPETYAGRSYRLLLSKLAERLQDNDERCRIALMAVRDFPELPDFHAELAESYANNWLYEEAAKEMRLAYELSMDYNGMEPSLLDHGMVKQCQNRAKLFDELYKIGKSIHISACVITKNEEKNIELWLKNAKCYANQCLLMDTGSTDKTCELAMGTEIYHYKWADDFAAARNAALKHVTGTWVAFLDADEYFAKPQQIRGVLAECELMRPEIEAIRLTIRNIDADDGNRELSHFCNIRLFRNKAELRYHGRIHENLCNTKGIPLEIWEEPRVEVIHTGYSRTKLMEKTERNLALLKIDINECGEQPHHYRYLADSYYTLGEYRQAKMYAIKAIEAPMKGIGTHGDMYYMVLLCMKALSEPIESQLSFAETAHKEFPKIPDFIAVKGLLLYECGKYEQANTLLAQSCMLAKKSDGRESSVFGDLKAFVYAARAACESKLNNEIQAIRYSEIAMQLSPREEQVLETFCEIHQLYVPDQLYEKLCKYFSETEEDMMFLCRFCERTGFGVLYDKYNYLLKNRFNRVMPHQEYYDLLKTGNWKSITDKLQVECAYNIEFIMNILFRIVRKKGNNYRQVEHQLVNLLPEALGECWQIVIEGKEINDWDTYKILWQYAVKFGDDRQMLKVAKLAIKNIEAFSNIIDELKRLEKWREMLEVLSMVPADMADGKFWQDLGCCLYHLNEWDAAQESFEKARGFVGDTQLIKSYDYWMGRR